LTSIKLTMSLLGVPSSGNILEKYKPHKIIQILIAVTKIIRILKF